MMEFIEWMTGRRDPTWASYVDWRNVTDGVGMVIGWTPVIGLSALVLAV